MKIMRTISSTSGIEWQELAASKKRIRWAVAMVYFSMGLCFSSWASRIPDIKTRLELNDAVFGSILLALPIGQFLMMPLSGKLVTKFGSPRILLFSLPAYGIFLSHIGFVTSSLQLTIGLFFFGLAGNLCNISINSQGIAVEQLYGRPIMASFHGGWSLAGFTGALIGLIMINLNVPPRLAFYHCGTDGFCSLYGLTTLFSSKTKVKPGQGQNVAGFSGNLRVSFCNWASLAFAAWQAKGAMFDWSGIYFKDVVKAPASLVVLGYTSFMIMMAGGRFMADYLISKIGRKRLLQICGVMISAGLFTSVIFPYLIPSTIAFMIVGLGVSSIVPTVYSVAGSHSKVHAGIALATVSSVSFLGFLMGPPLIGYISELAGSAYFICSGWGFWNRHLHHGFPDGSLSTVS
jgi:MFS family permease